jgi:hypothetical protein
MNAYESNVLVLSSVLCRKHLQFFEGCGDSHI